MGFASHDMAYSVPSTSMWCHLGGGCKHIAHVFVTFCEMKDHMLYERIMPDWIRWKSLTNIQTPGERENTSLP